MNWIKALLADAAGIPDEVRVCTVAMIVGYLALISYDVVAHNAHFDMAQFGTGAGLLFAGIGTCFYGRSNH